ncbi:MAG: transcriptional regulator [Spirochaetes bacterium]|nr:MAG: transcriptional regulator [Spirochaetota bacterium]
MTSIEIGNIVLIHRKKSGLTQKGLAIVAGVGKTVVFDIEKGKETVQINSLLKVFSVLNISIVLKSPIITLMEGRDEKS